MTLTLKIITSEGQIGSIRSGWSELASTPMQSPEWQMGWWLAYKSSNTQLQILAALDQSEKVVGIAPLYRSESWRDGQTLEFLAAKHACSDYQTILCDENRKAETLELFGDWLADSAARGEWGTIELDGISEHDKTIGKLCNRLHKHDVLLRSKQLDKSWVIDLSQGWRQCIANMTRTQRRQSRNLINRFDKSDKMRITEHTDAHDVPIALRELIELHQKRWTQSGQSGCFSDPRFSSFLLAAAQALALRQSSMVRTLRIDDRPVASHLLLRDNDRYYMYQAGRDPDFASQKVGTTLNLATMRCLAERGAQFMDCLRGNEIYKSRLAGQPVSLYQLRLVAPAVSHRVRDASSHVGRNVKRTAKILAAGTGSGVRNVANIVSPK